MDKYHFTQYAIPDRSFVAYIKREIHSLVSRAGFTAGRIGEIDIIVSELTSNLVKHAGGGDLFYRLLENSGVWTFEILGIDKGRGIDNVTQMMRDGASTTNTLGNGLGAMHRLSDLFQIYSQRGWGTIAYCKVLSKREEVIPKPKLVFDVKALSVPIHGERVCGDGYYVKRLPHETRVFMGDGLGHGEKAHEAVETACASFAASTEGSPVDVIRTMHMAVKRTRGLVATVAILDHSQKQWRICGVGNISTRLYSGLLFKHYLAYNGIIGLNIPTTMQAFTLPAESNHTIIMSSDGLRTRWDLSKYVGFNRYDPTILAAILYKDFVRGTDDASVLIGRVNI